MNTLVPKNHDPQFSLLGSILAVSHEAMVAVGPGGLVEAANPRFLELVSWKGDPIGKTLDDFVGSWADKSHRSEVVEAYFTACRSANPPEGTHELQPNPGQVVEARFMVIPGEENQYYKVWLFQEWRTSALAWVSHEIKNPLNAVLGFSELLQDALGPEAVGETVKSALRGLRISAKHLQSVLGDLLALSRLESGAVEPKPEWVNLKTFLEDLFELFRTRFHRRGLEFLVTGPEEIDLEIWVDHRRLSQILGNLISNALRFTKKGHVSVRVVHRGPSWEFHVEDTGAGIPADQQQVIFDPFIQKHGQDARKFGGTGLGLAICKTLTQNLGGRLELTSEPGNGSRFSALFDHLPSRKNQPQGDLVDVGDLPECTVIVADDEQTNHLLVEGFLRDTKITVISAVDGFQAVELWKLHRPRVMVIDMRMPGLSGVAAARRIRDLDPGMTTRILGMSASRPDGAEVAEGWGVWSGFIEKPFGKQEFLSFLSNHVTFVDESPTWP